MLWWIETSFTFVCLFRCTISAQLSCKFCAWVELRVWFVSLQTSRLTLCQSYLRLWALSSPSPLLSSPLCCIALPRGRPPLMMLKLMSSPPPSIPGTAAPPFSLLSDCLTDRLTAGRRSIPHPSSCLSVRHPAPPSTPLQVSHSFLTDAPLLKLRHGGLSMYGCVRGNDAVG